MRKSKSHFVHRHIARLETCEVFATKDLLCYAPRSVVDKALQRMEKDGHIKRLARGVYAKWYGDGRSRDFSMFEVARAKAKAFGKWCPCHSCNTIVGAEEEILPDGTRQLTVKVHGLYTTSFSSGPNKIVLKGTDKRPQKIKS